MYCSSCGQELTDVAFCPECGEATGKRSPTPPEGGIEGHIRLLGILWLTLSALRLIPGIALLLFLWPAARLLPSEVPGFVLGLLPLISGIFLLSAALGIATGWGLLVRAPWARVLAIVAGVLNLMDIPLGTALGVYTLWVLLPATAEREYRSTARTA
jgi:hypothetical protein